MKQISKRHHYNPRMLLAGFTDSGRQTGLLWDFDSDIGKARQRSTKGVAWAEDFYSVDIPGEDRDIAENLFAKIENIAAPILRRILDERRLPELATQEFADFLYFLALMHVRGPRIRDTFTSFQERKAELKLLMALSTPERWDETQKAMRAAGRTERDVSYEDMRDFVRNGGGVVKTANAGPVHVKLLTESLDVVSRQLARRNWGLLVCEEGLSDFVTSDSPMTLTWTDPLPAELGPPGLGHRLSEVGIALSRQIALVGRREAVDPISEVDENTIADLNGRTAWLAKRHVYSPTEDFVWRYGDSPILDSTAWFRAPRHRRESIGE